MIGIYIYMYNYIYIWYILMNNVGCTKDAVDDYHLRMICSIPSTVTLGMAMFKDLGHQQQVETPLCNVMYLEMGRS